MFRAEFSSIEETQVPICCFRLGLIGFIGFRVSTHESIPAKRSCLDSWAANPRITYHSDSARVDGGLGFEVRV